MGKATSNELQFFSHIHGIDRDKSPLPKISGKVATAVLKDSKIFTAPIY